MGSRHDNAILRASQIEDILRLYAKGHGGRQMMIYGDKGYKISDVLMTPFPGHPRDLDPDFVQFNKDMSRCRIGVEHDFGQTRNIERLTQYEGLSFWSVLVCTEIQNTHVVGFSLADNQRINVNDVEGQYRVSVMFKNFCVCFGRGTQRVALPGPTLAEYLSSF